MCDVIVNAADESEIDEFISRFHIPSFNARPALEQVVARAKQRQHDEDAEDHKVRVRFETELRQPPIGVHPAQ